MTRTTTTDNGKTTWYDEKTAVLVKVYDGCKYDPESKVVCEAEYEISGYGIYNGEDFSKKAYDELKASDMVDEYDEYLKLWFGYREESATFRNSHVDMFLK